MPLIDWKEEYSVQVQEIDDQHKELIRLINQLHQAMADRKTKKVLGEIIDGLIAYTKSHFATEEKYFADFGYEKTDEHTQAHRKFVAKVGDFKDQFDQGQLMLSIDIINFLKDWLINHINGSDQQYAELFREKGLQ